MKTKLQALLFFLLITGSLFANTYVWNQKSNFAGGNRFAPFSFSIGAKGYVGCGITFSGSTYQYSYTDFWEYDAALDLWTQKASMPGPCRSAAVGFSIASKGYVTTGWTPAQTDTTYEYDPSINTWNLKANFGGTPRYSAVAFSIGSFAYVGMGYTPLTSDFWKYDPSSDAWTQIADVGGPTRQAASAFVLNGNGYVFGGTTALSNVINELWQYDPFTNIWIQKATMPGVGRYGASSFTMNGLGIVGLGNTLSTILNDFYAYDPNNDNWIQLPSLPTAGRYAGFTFSFNNTGFVGAGASSNVPTANLNNDLWELSWAPANNITGKLFMDFNNNTVQDSGETAIANRIVSEAGTGRIAFTRTDGSYDLTVLDSGSFTVTTDSFGFFQPTPTTLTASFSGINLVDSLNDFAFQAASPFNDLCISISPLGAFRPGFNGSFLLHYENAGTTPLLPTISFYLDPNVTYISSSVVPSAVPIDSVIWQLPMLNPMQQSDIIVTVNVNSTTSIGTELDAVAIINPIDDDLNPYCNYASWKVTVTGSFDPNDIAVNKNNLLTNEFPNPPFLEYMIRFQNTGNDTAFTVDVINTLPQELDVNSFEFISSSHPVVIRYIPEYSSLGFRFNNILLADSSTNEALSQGYIHYRIKPVSSLILGDVIPNSAGIYFDFNAPVLTNTAITTIVNPTSVNNVMHATTNLIIYPNPTHAKLFVLLKAASKTKGSMQLADVTGRNVISEDHLWEAGQNKVGINTSELKAGVYFLTVNLGAKKEVVKVLVR